MTEIDGWRSGAEVGHFAICARTRNVYNATLVAEWPHEMVAVQLRTGAIPVLLPLKWVEGPPAKIAVSSSEPVRGSLREE